MILSWTKMKKKFKLKIEPKAKIDIQDNISWYNKQQKGLGRKFHKEVKEYLDSLKANPFYELKYDNIRCLPLKKFPFTIHFSVNEDERFVIARSVFKTSQDPTKLIK